MVLIGILVLISDYNQLFPSMRSDFSLGKDKLGDDGVLLYPSSPSSASYHYTAFFKPFNFGYWCLFSVLRLPTCQVPLGLDKNGLPVGLQVVAAPYNDHLCFAVAQELEKAFGGWVQPA